MRHGLLVLMALSFVAIGANSASAEITIQVAKFAKGVLTVKGETSRPGQTVTLDRKYRTRTDRNNQFAFHVRYRPSDCIASIRAGTQAHPAVVSNCVRPAGRANMAR